MSGEYTAALTSPYLEADGKPTATAGNPSSTRRAQRVRRQLAEGFQVHVHGNRDRGVREALDRSPSWLTRAGPESHRALSWCPRRRRRSAISGSPRTAGLWECWQQMVELTLPSWAPRGSLAVPVGDLHRPGAPSRRPTPGRQHAEPLEAIHVEVTVGHGEDGQTGHEPFLPEQAPPSRLPCRRTRALRVGEQPSARARSRPAGADLACSTGTFVVNRARSRREVVSTWLDGVAPPPGTRPETRTPSQDSRQPLSRRPGDAKVGLGGWGWCQYGARSLQAPRRRCRAGGTRCRLITAALKTIETFSSKAKGYLSPVGGSTVTSRTQVDASAACGSGSPALAPRGGPVPLSGSAKGTRERRITKKLTGDGEAVEATAGSCRLHLLGQFVDHDLTRTPTG